MSPLPPLLLKGALARRWCGMEKNLGFGKEGME